MKLKNILLSALSMVLVAALAIGGTVAYLQDDDSDVNVMTLGNVSIEQIEQEWNAGEIALQDFTQAKPLYPYVGNLGWENTTDNGGAYRRFTMNNVVDKYVSVKNTGKSDAYVRTIIALEMGDYNYNEFNVVGISVNKFDGAEFQFPGAWDWTDDFVAQIDGKNYNIMVAVHKDAIEPGETTIPSLLQVYMNKDATNEDCEKIDGNGNGTYDILVVSQAIQAAGFDNAETALNAGFGDITTTNHPWADGVHVPDLSKSTLVSSADELAAALAAGENVVLSNDVTVSEDTSIPVQGDVVIDLAGNTLSMTAGDNAAAAKAISVFTVANGQTLTIEGGEFIVNFGKNGTNYSNGNVQNNLFNVQNGGKLVINDGTFKATMVEDGYNLVPVIIDNNGEVVINGGSFSTNAINLFRNTNGKMTINDGTFSGTTYPQDKEKYPYSVIWDQYANAELIVNGGTFTNLEVEKEGGTVTIASGIDLPLWKPLAER